ncbi:GntR family transcriptional regulator [Thermophilibacter immobilis]|jgi:GntR family transcriptional regulator|uniref:GntR family transcriptional regulator n=1 Tax=Thermophilibacter immobilis TaxID=2779519 RepID=A0A7S7RUA6_9ACTN|nr:GntR family transcriptional regulator [Thermophilibacter immobilis]QOY60435.1 GntR family transcriptional regulator [Thermophilibacter immobilis]
METLYSSIKNDLLAKIKNGTYAVGDVIPTEVALAKEYGVSRPTIRQALQILVNAGYLDKRKRRGTIVMNPDLATSEPETPLGGSGVRSFEDEIAAAGRAVRTLPILVKEEPADDEVAAGLRIAPGDPVYKLIRLRYVDDVPNVFMENYVPCALFPNFTDCDFSQKRLYERMTELGHPVKRITRHLEVIKADSSISVLLDVPVGDPLFYFHTVGRDENDNIVEYSASMYRGSENSFEFEVAPSSDSQRDAFDGFATYDDALIG